jgi:hypothetical protein
MIKNNNAKTLKAAKYVGFRGSAIAQNTVTEIFKGGFPPLRTPIFTKTLHIKKT